MLYIYECHVCSLETKPHRDSPTTVQHRASPKPSPEQVTSSPRRQPKQVYNNARYYQENV